MKNEIRLATLDGCKFCDELKNKLTQAGIPYIDISCKNHGGFCDQLELKTGIDKYPMALVSKDGINSIVCITGIYQDIGKSKEIEPNVTVNFVHSIDSMIDYIKKQYIKNKKSYEI